MTGFEPELAGDRPAIKPGHIWITRRRWDAYFLVGVLAAGVCGLPWLIDPRPALSGALVLAALWLFIRWGWPREGLAVRSARKTPGMVPLLIWLTFWGIIGMGGSLLFVGEIPMPEDAGQTWTLKQWLSFAAFIVPWFAGLLLGVHRIERRFKKPRPADPGGLK
ncbi:MAG: hypothetical protein ABI353_16620 [Isosphaeraceae bacterium]